jgi:hypothetical protein
MRTKRQMELDPHGDRSRTRPTIPEEQRLWRWRESIDRAYDAFFASRKMGKAKWNW